MVLSLGSFTQGIVLILGTIYLSIFNLISVFSARNVRLSVLTGQVKGSSVVVCASDIRPLIFMCECTGTLSEWFLDPLIPSSNAIDFDFEDEPGDIISQNSLTAFLIKKSGNSPNIVYESQLFVPIDAIHGMQSLPVKVVCKCGESQSTMAITTPGIYIKLSAIMQHVLPQWNVLYIHVEVIDMG